MTPDVVVDIGNTRIKWGRCTASGIGDTVSLAGDIPEDWSLQVPKWNLGRGLMWAVAGVQPAWQKRFTRWAEARGDRVVPITHEHVSIATAVDEPGAVGIDRLLNALAASRSLPAKTPAVVISVGTAVTVDCIDADKVFLGGAILPGPVLMARSLHQYTAKLPLVDPEPDVMTAYRGKNTVEAIQIGIQLAIVGAAEEAVFGFASDCKVPPAVFITGGERHYFGSWEFVAETREVITTATLTLEGIRIAAEALP